MALVQYRFAFVVVDIALLELSFRNYLMQILQLLGAQKVVNDVNIGRTKYLVQAKPLHLQRLRLLSTTLESIVVLAEEQIRQTTTVEHSQVFG